MRCGDRNDVHRSFNNCSKVGGILGFLDIAVAMLIGFSSIAMLVYQSPVGADIEAHRFLEEASLRNLIVSHVNERGIEWFQDSSVALICADIQSMSNSTFAFVAVVDYRPCSPGPFHGSALADVTIATMARTVVIEGWQRGQG